MNTTEFEKTANDLIYIISCGINGTSIDKARVQSMDLAKVLKLASKHMLGSAVGMTLEMNGIKNELTAASMVNAVRRDFFFEKAWSEISQKFEEEGIWYLPLKGAVIKSYYPKDAMREYSDYDILIDPDRAGDVRTIMEGLGYNTKSFGVSNQDVYEKEPVYNFEIHSCLVEPRHGDDIYDYYLKIKDKLLKDEGNNFGYHFSDEDFYIYFVSHEYKHFSGAGTGLRSLVDTYVINRHLGGSLDMEYLSAELQKLGLSDFECKNRQLADKVFTGQKLDDEEKKMLDIFIFSSTYGNFKTRMNNRGVDGSLLSKVKYAFKRLSLPERDLKENHPFFYKHKLFRPLLYAKRLVLKAIKSPKVLWAEVKELKRF